MIKLITGSAIMNARLNMDANEVADTLADEVHRWGNETRAILTSIKRIVEYFGTDQEYESLLAALYLPQIYLEGVLTSFRDPAWRADTAGFATHTLTCDRGIAEKITPLLQILVEPVPEFVPWARDELEQAHSSAVIWHFGAFSVKIGENICDPIWQSFRDLAPEGYPLAGSRAGNGDPGEQADSKLSPPKP